MFAIIQKHKGWKPKVVAVPHGVDVRDLFPGWFVWSNRVTKYPNTYYSYEMALHYSRRCNLPNKYLEWQ